MNRTSLPLVLVILVILGFGGLLWYGNVTQNGAGNLGDEYTLCTADAQLCPDGSYVNRTGPTCEFTACPVMAGWVTTTTPDLVTFSYPETPTTTYIDIVNWPPKVTYSSKSYFCAEGGSVNTARGETEKIIRSYEFCRTTKAARAAGNAYTDYTYTWESIKGGTATLTFGLRFIPCGDYNTNEQIECEREHDSFNVDDLFEKIWKTATF